MLRAIGVTARHALTGAEVSMFVPAVMKGKGTSPLRSAGIALRPQIALANAAAQISRKASNSAAPVEHSNVAAPTGMSWSLAKFKVTAADDPLEREADGVAEQVLRTPDPSFTTSARAPQVSRKCAACEEEDRPLHAKRAPAAGVGDTTVAPDVAVRATQRGGEPLPLPVRSYFEPRFGHDLSRVRIHSDGEAATAANAVRARAFTMGRDIVFGSGEYAPTTEPGRRLLAHELVHVLQQGAADRRSPSPANVTRAPGQISRKGLIDLEVDPDCPPGMLCFTILNPNMAHRELSKQDNDAIVAATGGAAPTGSGLTFSKAGPRFVLHDTATSFGPPAKEHEHLARLKGQDSTPPGEGSATFVTAAGAAVRTHSKFFNAQRPTATEFERGNDIMGLFGRETTLQQIWSLTDPSQQSAAISGFLALFPSLSRRELVDETSNALKNLDPSKTKLRNKPGAKAVIFTTATGAVARICDAAAQLGAAQVALPGQDAALATACARLQPVVDARRVRIADSTNIEIVANKGTDCDASAGATPFAGYPAAAYDSVAKIYALAALEAGQFPEITTHYFLDASTPAGSTRPVTSSQNRCDPRCFNLDLLYAKIATILNHPAGTTYGVSPRYGTNFSTSTIWWPTNVCGPTPGAQAVPTPPPARPRSPPAKSL